MPASLQRSDEGFPLATESSDDVVIDETLQCDMVEMKVSPLDTHVASNRNPPATAAELRQSLGITDNEDQDNWDDVDDWDSLLPPPTDENTSDAPVESIITGNDSHAFQTMSARQTPMPVAGLRPGRKVSR